MTEPSQQSAEELMERDFLAAHEPFVLFSKWMAQAEAREPRDANAMALATVDAAGLPNVRTVLLKNYGPQGLVFFTNAESSKGIELNTSGKAAIVLYWKSLNRQIRARGKIVAVDDAESDAYFASRAREAQIGAWASQQSRALSSRAEFEAAIKKMEER
ncbi:MAG: pyridoxal 5'-phosphate synthase, partial [Pseudomonadota bacterium]